MSQTVDTIKVTGVVEVDHFDESNNVVSKQTFNNLVVTVGKKLILDRLIGTAGATSPCFMALGTGDTPQTISDVGLVTEVTDGGNQQRVGFNSGYPKIVGNTSLKFQTTFPAGTATADGIQEVGIFNHGATGVMLCRTTFSSPINKSVGDVVNVTWTIAIN